MRQILSFLLACAAALSAAQVYRLVDLGANNPYSSVGYSVNDLGQVCGDYGIDNNVYQAFTTLGTQVVFLGTLGGTNSAARGINASGQISGYSNTSGGSIHAFIYSSGTMIDLGTLGGAYSEAWGINSLGEVAGYSALGNGAEHAFKYSGGMLHDLGVLPGGRSSQATGINDLGQVTGASDSTAGSRAFLYSGSSLHDLGTFPGGTQSAGYAINSSGVVVGESDGTNIESAHAFLYDGSMHDLGALGTTSAALSIAYGVNDSGQVVGGGRDDQGLPVGFLYSGGTMHNILELTDTTADRWMFSYLVGISNNGYITGMATDPVSGGQHAVLLIPESTRLIVPDGYSFGRGRLLAGNLASLGISDDNHFVMQAGVIPIVSDYPINVTFTGTSPVSNPSVLRFGLEASAQFSNVSQTVELYDYSAGAFVPVDVRTATTSDSVVYLTLSNPSRFVNPVNGQMQARIKYKNPSPEAIFLWRASLDRVVWEVTP
ncbi:MAG TPA: hypothetical protein VHE55_16690 [Fimbriimonadaceae bacterium]|nr:hypothetical protein [Fimbriimonadaceae bacterium]